MYLSSNGMFEEKLLAENSASTSSDEEIVIEIEWNDSSEIINLKSY